MARSGSRTVIVTITAQPAEGTRDEYREVSDVPADQAVWKDGLWARMVGEKGGELSLAQGVEAQPTVSLWFDYLDVMDPVGGVAFSEAMNLRVVGEDGLDLGSFDIDRIIPNYEMRDEVRVMAIRKRLAV